MRRCGQPAPGGGRGRRTRGAGTCTTSTAVAGDGSLERWADECLPSAPPPSSTDAASGLATATARSPGPATRPSSTRPRVAAEARARGERGISARWTRSTRPRTEQALAASLDAHRRAAPVLPLAHAARDRRGTSDAEAEDRGRRPRRRGLPRCWRRRRRSTLDALGRAARTRLAEERAVAESWLPRERELERRARPARRPHGRGGDASTRVVADQDERAGRAAAAPRGTGRRALRRRARPGRSGASTTARPSRPPSRAGAAAEAAELTAELTATRARLAEATRPRPGPAGGLPRPPGAAHLRDGGRARRRARRRLLLPGLRQRRAPLARHCVGARSAAPTRTLRASATRPPTSSGRPCRSSVTTLATQLQGALRRAAAVTRSRHWRGRAAAPRRAAAAEHRGRARGDAACETELDRARREEKTARRPSSPRPACRSRSAPSERDRGRERGRPASTPSCDACWPTTPASPPSARWSRLHRRSVQRASRRRAPH